MTAVPALGWVVALDLQAEAVLVIDVGVDGGASAVLLGWVLR